jgi:hypothetical protein
VVPEPARRFAEYVGSIVLVASAVPRGRTTSTKLPCRHCSEFVEVRVVGEPAQAEWGCPGCGEEGVVSNWRHAAFFGKRIRPSTIGRLSTGTES